MYNDQLFQSWDSVNHSLIKSDSISNISAHVIAQIFAKNSFLWLKLEACMVHKSKKYSLIVNRFMIYT